jgi:hypothetical protein
VRGHARAREDMQGHARTREDTRGHDRTSKDAQGDDCGHEGRGLGESLLLWWLIGKGCGLLEEWPEHEEHKEHEVRITSNVKVFSYLHNHNSQSLCNLYTDQADNRTELSL